MRFLQTDPNDPTPFYMTPLGKLILVGAVILVWLATAYFFEKLTVLFLWIEKQLDIPLSSGLSAILYIAVPSLALFAWYLKKKRKTPPKHTALLLNLSSLLMFGLAIGLTSLLLAFTLVAILTGLFGP